MHALTKDQLLAIVTIQSEISDVDLSLQAVMDKVIEGARSVTRANAGVIELPENDEMVYRAVSGSAKDFVGLRLPISASLSGRCVTDGEILYCRDSATDNRVNAEACSKVGAVSLLCVPLIYRDQIVGVLKVYSSVADAFGKADIETLQILGKSISSKVAQAIAFEASQKASTQDALTGLSNRRAFNSRLASEYNRHLRYGQDVVLCLIDLDGFKQINDIHGHAAGDTVLQAVARHLQGLRQPDEAFRIGGDEFALILPGTTIDDVQTISERISTRIMDDPDCKDVALSFGFEPMTPERSADQLFEKADSRLYSDKHRIVGK